MGEEQTTSHIVSYPDIKEPQKPLTEKHRSPRKAAVLSFNPDGSLCIPADLKEKLVHQPYETGTLSSGNVTQDSRKRKKNASSEVGRKRKGCVGYTAPPAGCCHFCYTNETKKILGDLREIDGILAHHTCLLFSSGLCQAGKNDEGLWGFLSSHIKKEISRGKRLRCSFCKLPGAVVGCHKTRCSHSYHLTCGLDNGCLMQFYDNFRSFCFTHRPRQYHDPAHIGKTVECPICGDCIEIEEKVVQRDVLVTECCNLTPLHRHCLQNQAYASGYFYRCPMCNNEKKFNSIMKIMGISIPQSDATWEKDGYYDDLYVEYWNCDVPICVHPEGRKGDSRNGDKWDLMRCSSCGQAGAHPACVGHERRGPADWRCGWCLTCERKYEKEKEDEERKRREHPELYPHPDPPGPSGASVTISISSSDEDEPWVPSSKLNRATGASAKKPRKRWTPEENEFLEACFQKSWFLTSAMKQEILTSLDGVEWHKVHWWYGHRRARYKATNEGPPRWNTEVPDAEDYTIIEETPQEKQEWVEQKRFLETLFRRSAYLTQGMKEECQERYPGTEWHRVLGWFVSRRHKQKRLIGDLSEVPNKPLNIEASAASSSSGASSSSKSSKPSKKAPLSPSKDPYLWTPNVLKEAVFKLCVAKLKKDKVVKQGTDPDSWRLNVPDYIDLEEDEEDTSDEDDEPAYKYRHLRNTPFSLTLTRATIPDGAVLTIYDNYDVHKERLWERIKVLHRSGRGLYTHAKRGRGRPPGSASVKKNSPPRKQITLYNFMKGTRQLTRGRLDQLPQGRLDQENYVAQAKRRKVDPDLTTTTTDKKSKILTENKYEPFPFKRSPHQPAQPGEESVLKTPVKTKPSTEPVQMSSPSASYQCYFCTDKFSKMSIRMEHMRTIHNSRIKSWDSSSKHKSSDKHPIPVEDDEDDEVQILPSSPAKKHPACPKQPPSRPSALKRKRGRSKKKPSPSGYQEELLKYADFTIEVTKHGGVVGAGRVENKGRVGVVEHGRAEQVEDEQIEYGWSDNEIYSLIEYYSLNRVLWDTEKRDEDKEETLIKRLKRKLKISSDNIISKWNELTERYKEERYKPGSSWKFKSNLEFLDEVQLTNCPDDVSPLFSLLSGVDGHDDESKEEHESLMNIFRDVSDDEEEEGQKEEESYNTEPGVSLCSEMMSYNEEDSDFITSADHLDFS